MALCYLELGLLFVPEVGVWTTEDVLTVTYSCRPHFTKHLDYSFN